MVTEGLGGFSLKFLSSEACLGAGYASDDEQDNRVATDTSLIAYRDAANETNGIPKSIPGLAP